jgi:serine/threonine protein kinase/tetratricopeptide (TPR) repeat protein
MIGKTISHYEILEELGRGGMGVVYKAEDTKLKRTVALKFLKSRALEETEERTRFLREAQSAAALDHPNICTVYEVGETDDHTYISMAYIEGESLRERVGRGPVPLAEALDYALQAAEGLKAAHDKGIVHRDIKSANLMVTPEGRVKVMDFGLAKTAGATKVTRTGTTLGTVAYMSPEQALGREMDSRSDLWSLGVVLYEMLAGRLPFAGEYDAVLLYAIVNENPEPLTEIDAAIPLEVERLVDRLIEKDPSKRYQSAGELIEALEELQESLELLPKRSQLQVRLLRQRRRIAGAAVAAAVVIAAAIIGIRHFTGTARAIDSIAILPFENLSTEVDDEMVADAMMRELTAVFGQVSSWKVISSRSMAKYKETDKTPGDIASEVNVKVLVGGALQRLGDQMKFIIEMIDGRSEQLIWTGAFTGGLQDIKNIQNDITRTIATAAAVRLTPGEEILTARKRTVDPDSYRAYLEGRFIYDHRELTDENIENIIDNFEKSIAIDSTCAEAYAGLSEIYFQLTHDQTCRPPDPDVYAKAKAAALKAIEIDDNLAEGHAALAHYLWEGDFDFAGAEKEFERTFELNPSYAYAYVIYGYLLEAQCRFDEAAAAVRRASELDPLSRFISTVVFEPLLYVGKYEEAIEQIKRTKRMFPDWTRDNYTMGRAFMRQGAYDEAIRYFEGIDQSTLDEYDLFSIAECHRLAGHTAEAKKATDRLKQYIMGQDSIPAWQLAVYYAYVGERDEAGAWLQRTIEDPQSSPLIIARIYAELGDLDKTFEWLEQAYDERIIWLTRLRVWVEYGGENFWVGTTRIWKPLANDPRYRNLVERMGLTD